MMSNYQRILLKLSGEALSSDKNTIDLSAFDKVATMIKLALDKGVEIGVVVGGGNIVRGATLAKNGINRVSADHIGMLATVMNALVIADVLIKIGIETIVMSGFFIGGGVCEPVDRNKAKQAISEKKVVIFSAGTGNPFFTTDTAAVLRGVEIEADAVFKATKVDGIYTDDPVKNPTASRYQHLSFNEAIEKNLKVMDMSAFTLCQEHDLDICVFNMLADANTLYDILNGEPLGTIVRK